MTPTLATEIKTLGAPQSPPIFIQACCSFPKEGKKLEIKTDSLGKFVGSRHGHYWTKGIQVHDGFDTISIGIKNNDWWRYIE